MTHVLSTDNSVRFAPIILGKLTFVKLETLAFVNLVTLTFNNILTLTFVKFCMNKITITVQFCK